jgi:hypothetical protein
MSQRLPVRLLAAFVIFLALRSLVGSTYRAAINPTGLFGVDYKVIHMAAMRLEHGEPVYMSETEAKENGILMCQFTCSPFVPLLARPLTRLSLEEGAKLWVAISVCALVLSVFLFCWGSSIHLLDSALSVLLILFTGFRCWPTILELAIGNTHILLLACVCGMIVCNRYRKWLLLAGLVAVAALIKTWMIGMIFPLLVARRWREAAGAVAMFVAGLGILFSITGWDTLQGFLTVTREYSSEPFLVSNSVSGLAGMFFANNTHMTPWLPNFWAWLSAMTVGYGILIAGLLLMFLRGKRFDTGQRQLCLALSVLALILGSPVSHVLYFVLALPAIWTVACLPWGGRHSVAAPVLGFLAYLILSLPSPCTTPIPENCRTGILSFLVTMTFLPTFLLWIYGVILLCRRPTVADPPLPAEVETATLCKV